MTSSTRIGTTIAGYRLEALLGRGGMSVVYRAEQVRLGRKVALKLLASRLSDDPGFRERFEHESRRAAELDHPNIVPIYDAGEVDHQLFIAMRYVQGTDLRSMIERDGALGLTRTLLILEQAANALDAAHDRDLIHRDVKPANILIEQPSERVYLTDFGVVKHTSSPGLTRTGVFVGTVDYAAPEQIEGLDVDARTDVYALGAVLFEALAGRGPFGREGEVAVMHAHLTQPPPSLHAIRPDLPRGLDDVIAKAMAKAKDDRYSSCEAMIAAARAASAGQLASSVAALRGPIERPSTPPATGASKVAAALPATVAVGDAAAITAPADGAPPTADATPLDDSSGPPSKATPPVLAPEQGGRSGGSRGPGWLAVLAAALVAAAVAGGIAAYVASSGSSKAAAQTVIRTQVVGHTTTIGGVTTATTDTSTGRSTSTSTQTQTGPLAGTQLARVVPSSNLVFCSQVTTPVGGAMETAECAPTAGSTRFYPDSWSMSVFASGTTMLRYYNTLKRLHHVGDGGQCNGVSWGGSGVWLHGPGKPGGHRFCYFQGSSAAVIVWTHERLGQADHVNFLGIAEAAEVDHPSLFSWWNFWHHNMGRILPGH